MAKEGLSSVMHTPRSCKEEALWHVMKSSYKGFHKSFLKNKTQKKAKENIYPSTVRKPKEYSRINMG